MTLARIVGFQMRPTVATQVTMLMMVVAMTTACLMTLAFQSSNTVLQHNLHAVPPTRQAVSAVDASRTHHDGCIST